MPEARAAEHGKLDGTLVELGTLGLLLLAFRSWWRTNHRNGAADSLESANARREQHLVRPGGPNVTTTSATVQEGQPSREKGVTSWVMSRLTEAFELNPAGLNWPRGVMFLDVLLVPLFVFWAIGYEQYLLSAVFGALLAGVADIGGSYRSRASRIALFALIGAAVTALGFEVGRNTWGWIVFAAFVVTLVAGLAIRLGTHGFVTAVLLNLWFIIAFSVAFGIYQHPHITSYIWAQVCAWVGGSALWIALTFIEWLIRGRNDRPATVPELPGDTSPRKLTTPMIMFAAIRALAIAGSVAIAFGFNLSHGDWMPIATIVAIKPSVEQTTLLGVQRVTGALLGAGVAILLLLIPPSEHGLKLFTIERGLEFLAIVLLMHAFAIRFWNYAFYYTAISAAVLILSDLFQPSNYGAEEDRVYWALCGVGIGVLTMLLLGLLAKLRARAPAQPTPQPTPQPA
jgi:uncharacterized membrane protein YccC